MPEFLKVILDRCRTDRGGGDQRSEKRYGMVSDITSLVCSLKDLENSLDYRDLDGFELSVINGSELESLQSTLQLLMTYLGTKGVVVTSVGEKGMIEVAVFLNGEETDEDKNFLIATLAYTLLHDVKFDNYPRIQFG